MSRKCCGEDKQPDMAFQGDCTSEDQVSEKNTTDGYQTSDDLKAAEWVIGKIASTIGDIPQVATKLSFKDMIGSWKCRWSIGRMDYRVEPGIYAVGIPDETAPVLVTANYKMTFDRLREQLSGLNLWIIVLDTDGVNVWCAAGKGTFGTDELIHRIFDVQLAHVVKHRTIILPQLGAVGIAAHEIKKQTGFHVVYGPVRAEDIKAFLDNRMKATEAMRSVRFTISDRIVLTPMELVGSLIPLLVTFGVFFVLNVIGFGHFGWIDFYGILGAVLTGALLSPILLPWLPGRAFSFKGGFLGMIWAICFLLMNGLPFAPVFGWLKAGAYFLLLPALSGFLTLNFTGSSTYTSLSGVDKEMKTAIPIMFFAAMAAILLLLTSEMIQLLGGSLI